LKSRPIIFSLLLMFGALPLLAPNVRAAGSWQCNSNSAYCALPNHYPGNCLLSTNGDNSTLVDTGVGFGSQDSAFSNRAANCDGVGSVSAYTSVGPPYGNTAANAGIVLTDTFVIPDYGQSNTVLNIGAVYLLAGYLVTTGLGALMSSTAQASVRFNLTGPGEMETFMQNGGQPWSATPCQSTTFNDILSLGLPYCAQTIVPLSNGNLYFNLNNLLARPGTWTLSMIVETNATAHATGYSSSTGGACIAYVSSASATGPNCLGPHGSCPPLIAVLGACPQQPPQPSNNCPSSMTSPCYYVQWLQTTYSINLTYSGTPDFSIAATCIVQCFSGTRSSLDEDPFAWGDGVTITSINGFAGSVNLYLTDTPNSTVAAPPLTYLADPNSGAVIPNGTAFYVSPSSPAKVDLNMDPCAHTTPGLCTNGLCATAYNQPNGTVIGSAYSSDCKANYKPQPPATPGLYIYRLTGISSIATRSAFANFVIPYYDFAISNVATSYFNGILTVNATMGNIGNSSIKEDHVCLQLCPQYDWGEYVSYYLDGNLQNSVPLCGQGSGISSSPFLYFGCPHGKMFDYVWTTQTTSGPHNVTVTAIETAPCCNILTNFFDVINTNNDRFDSDFVLAPISSGNPPLLASPGSTVGRTVTIAALPDFSGNVSLSGSVPSGWGLSFNPSTVSLNPSQYENVTATILVPNSATYGSYMVNITGTGPFSTHSLKITVCLCDFSISSGYYGEASPSGATAYSRVLLDRLGNLNASITLSATITPSSGLSCTLNPISVVLNTTLKSASSILSCSGSPGAYNVVITGSSGPVSHSIVTPYSVLAQSLSFGGVNARMNYIFTRPSVPNKTIYGTIVLLETNSSSGSQIAASALTTPLGSTDNISSAFVDETPNSPFWLATWCTVKLDSTSTCSFERTPDVHHDGSALVDIVALAAAALAYQSTPTSPNWNPAADIRADGQVDLSDIATLANLYDWQMFLTPVSIMSLSAQSSNLIFATNSSASTTLTVASLNGWRGTLYLSDSVTPMGPLCSLSTTSGNMTVGSTVSSILTCSSANSGTYSVTVGGSTNPTTTMGLGNFVEFHLNVTDFKISSNSTSFSFKAGTSGSAGVDLSIASLYGFSGTVGLTSSASSGLTISCPLTVSISSSRTASVGCSITTSNSLPAATYTATFMGTSGSVSHSVTISVNTT